MRNKDRKNNKQVGGENKGKKKEGFIMILSL